MPVIDVETMLETVFHFSTLVVAFGTAIVAYRLTKFFRGGVFMKVWRMLFLVPFLMGLAEVCELLGLPLIWALAHLAACLAFLYSIYSFYREWMKMRT